MTEFRYEATDDAGQLATGQLACGSLREAMAALKARGLYVRRVEPVRVVEEAAEIEEFLPEISPESAANIAELFGDAVEHQLPLEPALRAAAEEAPRKEARVLRRLANDVASGTPPDKALANLGEALPMGLTALIQAGTQTGQLPQLLSHYVRLARQRSRLRAALAVACVYPVLLLAGMIGLVAFILLVVTRSMAEVFLDFGTELPWITKSLIWTSDQFSENCFIALGLCLVLMAVGIGTVVWLRRHGTKLTRFPPIAWLTRPGHWGQFCGLLSLMVQAKQPMPRSLRIISVTVVSPRVQLLSERIAADIEAGQTAWEAAHRSGVPGPVRHALRWANEPEFFVEALDGLAEVYGQQNQRLLRLLPLLLEPALLMGITFVLGYVILALFMPLLKLITDMASMMTLSSGLV